MNILTHVLATLALLRAGWPRAPKELWVATVTAGVIADVDLASAWFGASAWWRWHRGFTHSLLFALILAAAFAVAYRLVATDAYRENLSATTAFVMAFAAALLHLLIDVCGWQGAALLWPFSPKRFALEWVANLDLPVIAVLLGALLLPELLHLVTSEIGARETRPRGRIGARVGFMLIALYLCLRGDFHSNVVALMDSRTFRGEAAQRVGAFPEPLSPLPWHGIVETTRALHTLTVIAGPVGSFDPETADTLYKPEPSPALNAAEQSAAARDFLRTARFPRASVETTAAGTEVMIRDLRYEAAGQTSHEVVTVIRVNTENRVVSQALVWLVR